MLLHLVEGEAHSERSFGQQLLDLGKKYDATVFPDPLYGHNADMLVAMASRSKSTS